MKHVDLYTDGACSGNPGPGGYGCVLIYKENQKELSGGFYETTNNRMELFAIIQGLKSLKLPCEVTVYSDSALCINSMNNGWLENWQRNGWKTSTKDEVKNKDLWKALLIEMEKHKVNFVKVKGHSDNEFNNRCDTLATGEIDKLIDRKRK
ncbi:MAG: ribonuclease HI [Clostridia bacterium]